MKLSGCHTPNLQSVVDAEPLGEFPGRAGALSLIEEPNDLAHFVVAQLVSRSVLVDQITDGIVPGSARRPQ
jgi:hypothetical protein